jgi:hypothetical protein
MLLNILLALIWYLEGSVGQCYDPCLTSHSQEIHYSHYTYTPTNPGSYAHTHFNPDSRLYWKRILSYQYCTLSIRVAARSKAWNAFARSNTGIVGSNPTEGIDVCVYSVFVLSCSGICHKFPGGASKRHYWSDRIENTALLSSARLFYDVGACLPTVN